MVPLAEGLRKLNKGFLYAADDDCSAAPQAADGGLPDGDGGWHADFLLLSKKEGLPTPTPHQDSFVDFYRTMRGGIDEVLAGPVQALHVLCTCYAVDMRTVRLCLVHAVHVPAATLQLRIAVMLTRTLILVLTCRAHMHPLLDALGPVHRALRAGLLLTGVHVSAAEAAPGGADFCLFEVTKAAVLLRKQRARALRAAGGDSWRRALELLQKDAATAVVLRIHRRCGTGAAILPSVLCLGSAFDHGGCAREEVRAPAAAKYAMASLSTPESHTLAPHRRARRALPPRMPP